MDGSIFLNLIKDIVLTLNSLANSSWTVLGFTPDNALNSILDTGIASDKNILPLIANNN